MAHQFDGTTSKSRKHHIASRSCSGTCGIACDCNLHFSLSPRSTLDRAYYLQIALKPGILDWHLANVAHYKMQANEVDLCNARTKMCRKCSVQWQLQQCWFAQFCHSPLLGNSKEMGLK